MALINQNSIIGLTSITSPSSSNVLTVHTNDTTERLRVSTSGLSFSGTNASLDTSGNISAVDGTFTGNVSIGGTLTYEDVTNIDAVGIITARNGVNITGGNLQIGGTNILNSGRVLYNVEQIKLADTKELVLGSGDDLKIYHSGSHSFISEVGAGALKIKGDDIRFEDAGGTEALRITSAGNIGVGGLTTPGALLSIPAGESNTPRFAIESAVDDNDFTITQYEDGNGIYTMLGQNVKLNSGGNNTILDSGHRTAGILLDARNHGAITFLTGAANAATENVKIDSSGRMLLGTTTEGEANADDLTVATSGHTGMTIRSGTANRGNIYFSDGTSGDAEYRGYITYDHDGDKLKLGTANADRLLITSDGNATFKHKVNIGDSHTGGEILSVGKSSGTSYMSFHTGGANMGFIGYADQLISGGASNELGIRSQDDLLFATGGNTERLRVASDGELKTQLKITMRENTIDAFSFHSNGANGYFRLTDEYDNVELLRFHGDGALSINTTSLTNYSQTSNSLNTNNAGGAAGNWSWRRDNGAVIQATDADSGWSMMYLNKYEWNSGDDSRWISFYLNGHSKDTINWNGSNIIYGNASDYRIKENIRDFTSGIDKIKQLKVHLYDYIDPDRGTDHIGFIAHELQEIIPEAVSGEKDAMRKEEDTGNDVMDVQMVDHGKLTPVLTAALQEALAKIETLEAKVAALEGS